MSTSTISPMVLEKREEILRICAKHGAGNVRVFGSRARGDARPDSDLDLLVDIVGPTSDWWPGGLIVDLEELLGRHIDVVSERSLNKYLRERILGEAIAL